MDVSKGLLMAAACAAMIAGGCRGIFGGGRIDTGASGREQAVPTELIGQSRTPISDIPVPMRFELDQGRSRSWATGGVRVVDHRYTGPDSKWAVGRFYKRHMPNHQWVFLSDQMIQGRISLQYVKGNQRCVIEIEDGGRWRSGSNVNVQIFPEVQSSSGDKTQQY